jgi:hypothetical protein
VRSRHYEQMINGKWTPDEGNDYLRAARQRDFLILMMQRAIDKGARDPQTLREMAKAVTDGGAVLLDNQLSLDDIINISRGFGDFEPENLERTALPTHGEKRNGADILVMEADDARPILDRFRGLGDTTGNADVHFKLVEARAPADRTKDFNPPKTELELWGFDVTGTSNAKEADRQDDTTITYSPDRANQALLLARNLGTRPKFIAVDGLNTLTLTVGKNWSGMQLAPLPPEDFAGEIAAAGAATTTTAPKSSASSAPTTTAAASAGSGVIGSPPDGTTCS